MVYSRFNILSLIAALVLCISLPVELSAQEMDVKLRSALQAGDVKPLSASFDDRVEIAFDELRRDYSKQQAQVVLNEFLSGHQDIQYTLIHKETSNNQSTFYIGKMTSSDGNYRVYLNVKRINDGDFIQAIKFESQ